MSLPRPVLGAGLSLLLALSLAGCGGGAPGLRATTTGALQVQISPASLSVPAGTGGTLTLTASRPLAPHYQGPLTITVEGLPAGIQAHGSVPADARTGSLSFWVDATVAPQTLANLRVVASGQGLSAATAFSMTILPPLPVGAISPDGVQASGRPQTGGAFANTPVAQEPVAATEAADSVQVVAVRHGYLPDTPSH